VDLCCDKQRPLKFDSLPGLVIINDGSQRVPPMRAFAIECDLIGHHIRSSTKFMGSEEFVLIYDVNSNSYALFTFSAMYCFPYLVKGVGLFTTAGDENNEIDVTPPRNYVVLSQTTANDN
jgi:hypothetical protein